MLSNVEPNPELREEEEMLERRVDQFETTLKEMKSEMLENGDVDECDGTNDTRMEPPDSADKLGDLLECDGTNDTRMEEPPDESGVEGLDSDNLSISNECDGAGDLWSTFKILGLSTELLQQLHNPNFRPQDVHLFVLSLTGVIRSKIDNLIALTAQFTAENVILERLLEKLVEEDE